MAGGKETPRQKMIGMMYLVLLAMLAMNVSKQIVYAFVTLNDKLATSEMALVNNSDGIYGSFDKKMTLPQDRIVVEPWMNRAHQVKDMADRLAHYLLMETSNAIFEDEGVYWHVDTVINDKEVTYLKPLMDIEGKDKFDGAARLFIEDEERGEKLHSSLLMYRDSVCQIMATYTKVIGVNKQSFTFLPTFDGKSLVKFDEQGKITDESELSKALLTANWEDTVAIKKVYKALSIANELHDHDDNPVNWATYTFDHAPVVATAAIITSLKVDVRNIETLAGEHFLSKVDVQDFKFNKIEPLAFAEKGYINQGDSINLKVMIAAYDSTADTRLKFGIDGDSLRKDWKTVRLKPGNPITLNGDTPGTHTVKGVIVVRKRGEDVEKPWDFSYTVGAPMGIVAQPEMRVLYQGYKNVVEGTASGFPADMVSLSGSGCSLSPKGNGQYIASVSRGTRNASISVSGKKADGSSVSLGRFEFDVRPMPPATAYFGRTENGGKSSYQAAKSTAKIRVAYDPSVPLTGVSFKITGGFLTVSGVPGKGKILANGVLDSRAKNLVKQAKNKTVSAIVDYRGPDNKGRKAAVIFDVK
jgi:hypothetical protein